VENLLKNMNPEELAFFAYMGAAPQVEVAAFRVGLNMLMSCFGEEPQGAMLSVHMHEDVRELSVHSFNVPSEDVRFLLTAVLDNVISTETNATGVEH